MLRTILMCFYFIIFPSFLNASGATFLLKNINLTGEYPKSLHVELMLEKFYNKKISLKDIKNLQKEIENFYKEEGYTLVSVKLPKQEIKDGVLTFRVDVAKIGKLVVEGNKEYSKEFIIKGFKQKEGDFLNYKEMIHSLLLLNDYTNLSVKSFLKKSELKGSSDVYLQVKDELPFHLSTWYDNLGSEDTSKNRIGVDFAYGNLFVDGDKVRITPVLSFNPSKTNYVGLNYQIPINSYQTKLKFGFLYADYIAAGDFTVLGAKGDTTIYDIALSHPILRSITDRVDVDFGYKNKLAKNYLLDDVSSKEDIDNLMATISWQHFGAFVSRSVNFSLFAGKLSDDSILSRLYEDRDFTKATLNLSLNRALSENINLVLLADGQYSSKRLPTIEMYSIGGLTTVRGFKSGYKLGDSGFFTSVEGLYSFDFISSLKSQIGLFADYGVVYTNEVVIGENKKFYLFGGGIEGVFEYDDKYSTRVSLGYPLGASRNDYEKSLNLYLTLSAKLW